MPRSLTLLFFCMFFSFPLFAQVNVLGKFSIGDSLRHQLLTTNRGDSFRGWVSAWTADSIVFQTNDRIEIAFPASAIKTIEVGDASQVGKQVTEIFALHTVDGSIYYGYPRKITEKQVIFTANNAGNIRLRPREVQHIEPVISTLIAREVFVNEYTISTKKYLSENGKFVGYQNGKILHNDAKGVLTETDLDALKTYKLLGQPLSYKGHGRSLMFAQTGFGMKPREKEYRNIMVGINTLSYGFSENISLSAGLISFLPYVDIKLSKSLGKYVHLSGGGYGFLPFSVGFHGAMSLGTPDYFLNIGYNKNIENETTYAQIDFEDFNCGASIRTGRRSRFFAEYHILTSKSDDDEYGLTFYQTGFANSFSWGYGWYNTRFRFETGVMQTGPYPSWNCFSSFSNNNCREYFHVPVPFISMAINFRR